MQTLLGLLAFPTFAFAQDLALKRVMLSSGGLGLKHLSAPASIQELAAHLADSGFADDTKWLLQRELSGIGETKAKAIVAYRDTHGAFASVDELLEVKGIGEATLEKNRDKLMVD